MPDADSALDGPVDDSEADGRTESLERSMLLLEGAADELGTSEVEELGLDDDGTAEELSEVEEASEALSGADDEPVDDPDELGDELG